MGLFSFLKKKPVEKPAPIQPEEQPVVLEEEQPEAPEPVVEPAPEPEVESVQPPQEPQPEKYLYYGFKPTGFLDYEKSVNEVLATENIDYTYTKRELIDYGIVGERVYKYYYSVDKVEFKQNPENEKEVEIYADGVMIGYVPQTKAKRTIRIISKEKEVSISCDIYGGKYNVVYEDYDYEKDRSKYDYKSDETTLTALIAIKYLNPKYEEASA